MPAACPHCGKPVDPAGPERPFCSPRCRLIDLGAWLTDGERSIPGAPVDDAAPTPGAEPDDR